MPIKCYILSPHWFCSGVKRAVSMAEQVCKLYGGFYIIEDVIHNRMFMNDLWKCGVVKVASIDEIPDNAVVMFSSHGVAPRIVAKAEEKGLTIIDGTCPVIKAVQCDAVKETNLGKKLIIIGDRAHAEVIALIGCADKSSNVFVVSNETDVELLPDFDGVAVTYFTQTTLDWAHVKMIIEKLKEKIPHVESLSPDNVCRATRERQDVVRKIAGSMDLVVVIGSAHSSNARRLYEIALSSGAGNAVLVDSKNEFDSSILTGVNTMAMTSSASTSEFVIQEFIEYLTSTFGVVTEDFSLNNDNDG
ncbi:MAG: 4-hydroxy-3-methylbut-2-enyl diphosphate reductase [Holosporales bacterium]|nr:4-hydroxy-3-methylbut-2-enyl diphosphate reductase [Holosporales bacterium]